MLINEFSNYIEKDLLTKYSRLKLKDYNPYYNNDGFSLYNVFLKENMYKDKKYLEDFYYEYGIECKEIPLTQSTIDHVQEKSRINVKALKDANKIIQYALYSYSSYGDKDYENKIDYRDMEDALRRLDNDDKANLYYSIISSYIDRNKEFNPNYNWRISGYYDNIANNKKELRSKEDIKNLLINIYNNIVDTADDVMKQKLISLMEKTGIANYEINQLDCTQIVPDYDSHWYGGDYGGMSYNFNGKSRTDKKDYGWVAVVKDLGWNIATDGNKFYLSKLSGPSTIEVSKSEVSKYLNSYNDKDKYENKDMPKIVLTEEKLIEYLTSNTKYEPTIGYIKVSISRFDPYFREGKYSGMGRIYSPDYGEKFTDAINRIKTHYTEVEDCESIELEPEREKVFYIKFKFLTKKEKQDVIQECEHYAYNLIKDNRDILSNYTKADWYLDAIKCNHFKLGEIVY